MTNQMVAPSTQNVDGLEAVEGVREGPTFTIETKNWKYTLTETRHTREGARQVVKYNVDVNGQVKLRPFELNGHPYPQAKVDAGLFEHVDDEGRKFVLVTHGGVYGGVPDEVQSHPFNLELFAAYDGFKLVTRARTPDHTTLSHPTHEPESVMAKYFPDAYKRKVEVEALVREYVTKGL